MLKYYVYLLKDILYLLWEIFWSCFIGVRIFLFFEYLLFEFLVVYGRKNYFNKKIFNNDVIVYKISFYLNVFSYLVLEFEFCLLG